MICFGKRREALSGLRKVSSTPDANPSGATESLTHIAFLGTGAYVIAGPESGQVYCFTAQDPEQMIDVRDTDALLRTGLFQIRAELETR